MCYRLSKKIFFCVLIFFICLPLAFATDKKISLEMDNVNLTDALRICAKFMNLNLIVSPAVSGSVSLHLHGALPQQAFDLLIASAGLVREPMGNVSFISSYSEVIKRKEDSHHLQEVSDEAAPLVTHIWQIRYAKAEDIAQLAARQ